MTITTAIRTRLLSIAAVTAIAGTRVTLESGHQGETRPHVIVRDVGEVRTMHLRGPNSLLDTHVQVDAYAMDQPTASTLSDACDGDGLGSSASGLLGFIGQMGGSPGIEVVGVMPRAKRQDKELTEPKWFLVSREYIVSWRQT